jgi:hypothetical protein
MIVMILVIMMQKCDNYGKKFHVDEAYVYAIEFH